MGSFSFAIERKKFANSQSLMSKISLKFMHMSLKGWWRAHHFITTAVGGVLLVWPDGECYQTFR